jgi:hypothetical protein
MFPLQRLMQKNERTRVSIEVNMLESENLDGMKIDPLCQVLYYGPYEKNLHESNNLVREKMFQL